MASSGDIMYPLVGGKLTGLRWVRVLVFSVPSGDIFPCRCTVTFADGVLTIAFGEGSTCDIDLSGGAGIRDSSGYDWVSVSAEMGDETPALVGTGIIELEPCCIFWLMNPLADLVSVSGWNPFPFIPGGEWGWNEDDTVLTAELPVDETATEHAVVPSDGLYMVNGLSSRLLEIAGSESVVVTAGAGSDSLTIGRGRRSAQS